MTDHLDLAQRLARAMFVGRTGHGGGPCTRRNLTEEQLAAFALLAIQQAEKEQRMTKEAEYRRPRSQMIGSGAEKLYTAEERLRVAFRAVVAERLVLMQELEPSVDLEADTYTHGFPQALYDLFDGLDQRAVRLALTAWLEDHPEGS